MYYYWLYCYYYWNAEINTDNRQWNYKLIFPFSAQRLIKFRILQNFLNWKLVSHNLADILVYWLDWWCVDWSRAPSVALSCALRVTAAWYQAFPWCSFSHQHCVLPPKVTEGFPLIYATNEVTLVKTDSAFHFSFYCFCLTSLTMEILLHYTNDNNQWRLLVNDFDCDWIQTLRMSDMVAFFQKMLVWLERESRDKHHTVYGSGGLEDSKPYRITYCLHFVTQLCAVVYFKCTQVFRFYLRSGDNSNLIKSVPLKLLLPFHLERWQAA